jgi:hypothetical protein
MVPDLPVIVIVLVPVAAVALAVSVKVLVEVAGFGLKTAVTPVCIPVTENVTLPLNPPSGLMVMVEVAPAPPCVVVSVVGEALSVKLGFIVRETVVLLTKAPDVPVTVIVNVPAEAVVATLSDKLELVAEVFGVKVAVTPVGRPLAAKETVPEKPFCGTTPIVLFPVPPTPTDRLLGVAVSEKFGGLAELTVSVTEVLAVKAPETPLIVRVTVPVVAVELAVRVSVLAPMVGFGLNPAVTPLGSVEFESVTLPVKPFAGTTLMVVDPKEPWVMVKLEGEAFKVKLGAEPIGQLFTKLSAFTEPIPVAKSQPVPVLYAG